MMTARASQTGFYLMRVGVEMLQARQSDCFRMICAIPFLRSLRTFFAARSNRAIVRFWANLAAVSMQRFPG